MAATRHNLHRQAAEHTQQGASVWYFPANAAPTGVEMADNNAHHVLALALEVIAARRQNTTPGRSHDPARTTLAVCMEDLAGQSADVRNLAGQVSEMGRAYDVILVAS